MKKLFQLTPYYRGKILKKGYSAWIKSGDKILDVGCGTGIISQFITENFNVRLTACDLENNLKSPLPFKKISKSKLPFKNNSFDIVMLNDVLHHIPFNEQEKVIYESLRVGKKVLVFEAKPTFFGKLFDVVLNKLHYSALETPLTFRTYNNWKHFFKERKIKSAVKLLKRPLFYPFSHFAMRIEPTSSQTPSPTR